mmetsp:Transcript_15337/g.53280  ORF Transcript_15337/g.53280 Transcript_15337/m.53280 type:complete len:216 (-) Transcript_15337:1077-1724(-)
MTHRHGPCGAASVINAMRRRRRPRLRRPRAGASRPPTPSRDLQVPVMPWPTPTQHPRSPPRRRPPSPRHRRRRPHPRRLPLARRPDSPPWTRSRQSARGLCEAGCAAGQAPPARRCGAPPPSPRARRRRDPPSHATCSPSPPRAGLAHRGRTGKARSPTQPSSRSAPRSRDPRGTCWRVTRATHAAASASGLRPCDPRPQPSRQQYGGSGASSHA